jgi:hypothetical protein
MLTALFTVDKTSKQPECSLADEWVRKMQNGIFFRLHKNNKETLHYAATWMNLQISC